MSTENPVGLRARSISKSYWVGKSRLDVLHSVDLDLLPGESICIMGSSGAGKSTLLHILGTLDRPSSGSVFWGDKDLNKLSDEAVAQFRNQKMGFVFQFHHLMSEFTALENVMVPCRIAGLSAKESRTEAEKWLEELGLKDRGNHFPSELSGGEQQRVSIARALVRQPEILFADEPTGNLDSVNSQNLQKLFLELRLRHRLTLLVVTHDAGFSEGFDRTLFMKDGRWLNRPIGPAESNLFPTKPL
jgi:lipoprotein-releasing system ATP-binding protein